MSELRIVAASSELRGEIARWRAAGEKIALVPTMGALHRGHLSLVELVHARAARSVVSIFVNPTQFAPGEDFASYPRTWDGDLAKLQAANVDLVFHPSVEDLYPPGFATSIEVGGPAHAGLEDRLRPTHFSGVATVVAKLLLLVQPDLAVFGEKDYQQVAVVRRLVLDLGLQTKILAAPTAREPDGLAMSSRNAYLSPSERQKAPALSRALADTAARLSAGGDVEEALALGRRMIESAGFALDYLELRDADALEPVREISGELRLLAAARIGRTRLIDNVPVIVRSAGRG
jgi:pantoate--beta-alanine ligase